jgi:tetratricopeptide (TPR) repeat protein
MDRRRIRIFISSPADVRPERLLAERVVRRLAREFAYHFEVEAVMWEREPLVASGTFQELIVSPHETDIVVVVLWSRLGVPLPADKFLGPLSKQPVTGTEWEFEDALASARERSQPDLLLYRKTAAAVVTLGDREQVEEQQRQIELVEAFMRRWTLDAEGKVFTAASWLFEDGAAFESQIETHLRALLRRRFGGGDDAAAPVVRWHRGSPYRGLESFEPEHEAVFFGRTRARNEVRELLTRQALRGRAFVLVTGASGSGKSSLVKAGLLPELRDVGMVGRAALVRYALTRPGTAGDPVAGLAAALLQSTALPELSADPLNFTAERLAAVLRRSHDDVTHAIGQGLAAAAQSARLTARGESRLLLVVDQLEELFTAEGLAPIAREAYAAALAALAGSGLVWVIATLRSDFYDRLERSPALAALAAGEAKYLLTAPDAAEIGQIIRRPANEAGLTFERDPVTGQGLDDAILATVSGSASLPLLQYLLEQLWQRRAGNGALTFAAYRELGGLEGAIGRRAEETLAAQAPEVQAALPRLLRALVTVRQGAGGVATARHARLDQFAEGSAVRRLVAALIDPSARLLVVEGATIRVAHEALLTHWPRARQQIAEDRADLQLRARLEEAAGRWQAASAKDQDSLLLAEGLPLLEAVDLRRRRHEELEPALLAYVDRSAVMADARQRRATRRLQATAVALALLALGASFGAWYGIAGQRDAQRQAEIARAESVRAAAQESEAQRQRAQAEREQRKAEAALKQAETNLDQALALFDTIMVDTVGQLEHLGLPRDRARALLGRLQPVLDALEGAQASDQLALRKLGLLMRLGDLYIALGDTTAADKHHRAALRLAADLASRDPANQNWQRASAMGHVRVADVMVRHGDRAGALASFRRALEINQRMADDHPKEAVWQRDLSVVHNRIGTVLLDQDDLPGALSAFQACLTIIARLAADDPANNRLQRDLAASHRNIGDVLRAQRDLVGALAAYRTGQAISERLAALDASNTEWQRDIARGQNSIGTVLRRLGDLSGALAAYRTGLDVQVRLVTREPTNTLWQHDLHVMHNGIGLVLQAQDDLPGALTAYRAALEIIATLVALDPADTGRQADLANSQANVGLVLERQGDRAAAIDALRAGQTIIAALLVKQPGHTGWADRAAWFAAQLRRLRSD